MKIAVIDSGIDKSFLCKGRLFLDMIVGKEGRLCERTVEPLLTEHGTICAQIIEKYTDEPPQFYSLCVSFVVCFFAKPLMLLFVDAGETAILNIGVQYLRIEGAFYCGIGCLFLLYGYYRAVGKPGMSVVLTVIALGTRVVLAYVLSALEPVGVTGIWWSVPMGWFLADLVGFMYYRKSRRLV